MSIHRNVAVGRRLTAYKGNLDEKVIECALRRVAIWTRWKTSSVRRPVAVGGQQHGCSSRVATATEPEVLPDGLSCHRAGPDRDGEGRELMLS